MLIILYVPSLQNTFMSTFLLSYFPTFCDVLTGGLPPCALLLKIVAKLAISDKYISERNP